MKIHWHQPPPPRPPSAFWWGWRGGGDVASGWNQRQSSHGIWTAENGKWTKRIVFIFSFLPTYEQSASEAKRMNVTKPVLNIHLFTYLFNANGFICQNRRNYLLAPLPLSLSFCLCLILSPSVCWLQKQTTPPFKTPPSVRVQHKMLHDPRFTRDNPSPWVA